MFIYYKKIYLIIFLTLFPFYVFASTPGTVVARDILFTSAPTEDNLDKEPKLEAPNKIDPDMYFQLAYPVIGCQATYTVQDRILLDVIYTNKLFGLSSDSDESEKLDKTINDYRTYLTNSFEGLTVILSDLKELAVPEAEYSAEDKAEIIGYLEQEDYKVYSKIWNNLWMSHANTPPDQFVMTLAKWTSDCFVKQADWRKTLDSNPGSTDL